MDCVFCKIIAGEIPSQKVYESENVLVIRDINPKAPTHLLIIPKEHIKDLNHLINSNVAAELLLVVKKLAKMEKIADKGYRVIINTGKQGGQLVLHLHLHLLGGKNLGSKIIAR